MAERYPDTIFLYPSSLTQKDEFKFVVDRFLETGFENVLLHQFITQLSQWEDLANRMMRAAARIYSHIYGAGNPSLGIPDYAGQIARCETFKYAQGPGIRWGWYADGCEAVPYASLEERQQKVNEYLQACLSSNPRARLWASGFQPYLCTSGQCFDQLIKLSDGSIVGYYLPVPYMDDILVPQLLAHRRVYNTKPGNMNYTWYLGWLNPQIYNPDTPQDDWSTEEWMYVLSMASKHKAPIVLGLTTEYLVRNPDSLKLLAAWRKGRY